MQQAENLLAATVTGIAPLAIDVLGLSLTSSDQFPLPGYAAGAHIDLHLPNGKIRQYSLSRAYAGYSHYEIAILRDPQSRGGSDFIHRHLKVGDQITISPPRNAFRLVPDSPALLVAGGIGITPILCMAEALFEQAVPFELHYLARTAAHAAYLDPIQKSPWSDRVQIYLDDQKHKKSFDPRQTLQKTERYQSLYVCGPLGLIDYIQTNARENGWAESDIHYEQFGQGESIQGGTPFQIKLTQTGTTIQVPANMTAAQALISHGIQIPLSCEQGICGACLIPVTEGIPDHRDSFLTKAERDTNRQFTPCCSRAMSPTLSIPL